MKQLIVLLLLSPALLFAQTKSAPKTNKGSKDVVSKPLDGYIINGNVKGFADGTAVMFVNQQTGQPEQKAVVKAGKFSITGKMDQPGFVQMVFAGETAPITLFLDNSNIKMSGSKGALDKFVITGSPSHTLYSNYASALKPYETLFDPSTDHDPAHVAIVEKLSEDLVNKNPESYVAPLAIIRLYQATENGPKAEKLFQKLPQPVQLSPMGAYMAQVIAESKINPLGSVLPEFVQEDSTGKPLSSKTYRGKYVLVDFWASWCRPCRMENPNVVAAYNKFKDRNFTVLGVSLDQAKPQWIEAIRMDGLTWAHVSDLKGWGNAVAGQFQIRSIPQNFLLDPEGRIIGKNLRGPVLEKKLMALLK